MRTNISICYKSRATFAHVADLLLEDVVAVFVNMGPQEVLEAVVDLQPGSRHGHPLPHSVALQTGKILSDPLPQLESPSLT